MIVAFLLLLVHGSHCFTLPGGSTAKDYSKGDLMEVKVNSLTSTMTQLPYPYYTLPFCQPLKLMKEVENFDQVLRGDRIQNSPYEFRLLEKKTCNVVCRVELDAKTIEEFKAMIDNDYQVNMILNDLPLARRIELQSGFPAEDIGEYDWEYVQHPPPEFQFGFPVGYTGQYAGSKDKRYYINNHLMFTVKYHQHPLTGKSQIVGFEVKPFSVEHEYEGIWNKTTPLTTCDSRVKGIFKDSSNPQSVEKYKQVIFTYDVEFEESEILWAARWDAYSLQKDDTTDWFSVMCSVLVLVFLSGTVLIILLRAFSVDLSKYYELETHEAFSATGLKVVHGDVFRPPSNPNLLCIFIGTGVQLLGVISLTLMLSILGYRSSLRTIVLLLWVVMGYSAGYVSVRLHKLFGGTKWKETALKTGLTFPSIVFTIFCIFYGLRNHLEPSHQVQCLL